MRVLRITPQVLPGAREPTVRGDAGPCAGKERAREPPGKQQEKRVLSCQEHIGSIVCHFCLDASYI